MPSIARTPSAVSHRTVQNSDDVDADDDDADDADASSRFSAAPTTRRRCEATAAGSRSAAERGKHNANSEVTEAAPRICVFKPPSTMSSQCTVAALLLV